MLGEAFKSYDRRSFLRLLGATMALAGITCTGCRRWPVEELRPHSSRPEGSKPGVAEYYATMMELDGVATGLLAKSYDGRPIKIEGNAEHPFSFGAASALAQASILDLYDPDRSRSIMQRVATPRVSMQTESQGAKPAGEITKSVQRSWAEFEPYAAGLFEAHRARQGDGLALLVQPTGSPTTQRLRDELTKSMPKARWFCYQPMHRDHEWAGSQAAFGRSLRCQYDLTKAQTILCFEADLLGSHPANLRLARDWAVGRRTADQGVMNRLIAVEAGWTVTGSAADLRIALPPTQIEQAIRYVATRVGVINENTSGLDQPTIALLDSAIRNLISDREKALVVAGPSMSAGSHHLVHAINQRLGCVGSCVSYTEEPLAGQATGGCLESIHQLSELLQGNVIRTLVIIGGNPVYDAPSDCVLDLEPTASRPLVTMHLSLHDNETSQACTWHIPGVHALEAWGDGRAWDGTYTLRQPLIMPLFEGKSSLELLSLIGGKSIGNTRDMVRDTFKQLFSNATAKEWEVALHNGLHLGSLYALVPTPTLARPTAGKPNALGQEGSSETFEIQFTADPKVHDGRFANNAWLQELPEPLSKLTWDNAALMSKPDADRLRVTTGDVIRLRHEGAQAKEIEIAVFVMPGQAIGCITLPLGYGRTQAGRIGNGIGVNVYPLRQLQHSYTRVGCTATKTGKTNKLASTQVHDLVKSIADFAMRTRLGEKGQPGLLVHEALLGGYVHDPHSVHGEAHAVHAAPLFNAPDALDSPHKWAMAIDLNACIGCSGCMIACQAENNVPVVGKDNVANNREMHWLRIDRYFRGDTVDPDVVHVPMACAHCETAPCEQVCPVAATLHDSEGLNSMIYNRCIGTRYCSNNCPFKVRRFNYFDYQATDPREPAKPWLGIPDRQASEDTSTFKKMVHNPEVTVRMRGVMEKCTYCVQRIVDARIRAKNEFANGERESDLVSEGEVQTACQATCPTQAIVFGDLNDVQSAVSQARRNPRSYEMLAELNLGARTTYLAKIRNRDS